MKIIFDFDGVLTDYNQFIQENAISYFCEKYHMKIVDPMALEIEEVFNIQSMLESYGYSAQEADRIKKYMLNRFWISHRFIKFSLLTHFRPGVREYINYLRKQGFIVEIHSSRSETCKNSLIGIIARTFTIWQCRLNGVYIRKEQFFFYPDDKEKVKGILKKCPLIVFEDKKPIIEQLAENGVKVLCVSGVHNRSVLPSNSVEIINVFDKYDIEKKIEKMIGKVNWICHKKETNSKKVFNKLSKTAVISRLIFHPIVLHPENIISGGKRGIIYAPNHRSTLDPLIIETVFTEHIHWVALSRFFKGEDSIFNNSKNPVLCNITKNVFRRLEYFPIERTCDNPKANNMETLKKINVFLKNGYKIGIFAEGTTRRVAGQDFGTFDDAFLRLAKKNKSWIQPITLLWVEDTNTKSKVIVNFGKAFQIGDMRINEGLDYFMEIQKRGLDENISVAEQIKYSEKNS
ncbi:MAG: 1-acyl-sn-glycerol-3-phosphate acyltransferase [Anaeroplasmataceae bacterium]|nr:1-acyl-sn-glycerol-3-phosphate acyltransferase [Anaeroplasmataceae bacterium]